VQLSDKETTLVLRVTDRCFMAGHICSWIKYNCIASVMYQYSKNINKMIIFDHNADIKSINLRFCFTVFLSNSAAT